ncbi:ATP phosphoribosyltransferase [uncultured Campylobacter sp.]|uniref:ATP phosphoribosyltransferase n=1 Tax=uncultured Campylobacter sp. TaxID=218934 RepID=UPI00262B2C1E|nr:ATP phosphoribosyltransferase [uncultured Campylobacter sp.]
MQKNRLKIAIQKSGRLSKESLELLKNLGIKVHIQEQNLVAFASNFNIDILRLRDDDIPALVFDGMVDLGIVGENVLKEHELERKALGLSADFELLKKLDFGYCRLSLALPNSFEYNGLKSFENLRIATSYPYILKDFMQKNNIPYKTCSLKGSVELAPKMNLADAICDLVSSGATLEANSLKEIESIFESKACLIKRKSSLSEENELLLEKLMLRIDGVMQARESKYIMLHSPKNKIDEIISLLPGVETPTILPLAHSDDKVVLHMVSKENLFWETMEKLKEVGASSILVLPIEKMLK